MKVGFILGLALLNLSNAVFAQTYAEKLGYAKGSKVIILHVDDVGMSFESNQGAIDAIEKGVASSMSMMMPCPWISGILPYLTSHPMADAGLHLTLTSEWNAYRWGPLAGKKAVPGLVDNQGALWSSVEQVVSHATADEVAEEIKSQLSRSQMMGWQPTHLDSHMGTLFASPAFLSKYIELGINEKIPVMFPGGHNTLISKTGSGKLLSTEMATAIGQRLWDAGLPVLDDLHNFSYDFDYPKKQVDDATLQRVATNQYILSFQALQPGITMVIMHCTVADNHFEEITDSGSIRRGDWLAMQSPELEKYLDDNQIIVTTWRNLMEKRRQLVD